jgi:hypothetical protein
MDRPIVIPSAEPVGDDLSELGGRLLDLLTRPREEGLDRDDHVVLEDEQDVAGGGPGSNRYPAGSVFVFVGSRIVRMTTGVTPPAT